MDVLLKLDLAETREFFAAFFALSDFHWQGFLSARLTFPQARPARRHIDAAGSVLWQRCSARRTCMSCCWGRLDAALQRSALMCAHPILATRACMYGLKPFQRWPRKS